jgi:hypothetical protein
LAILHNKSTFIGTIGRQYDDQFGQENAKIGNQLKIRLPNQYNYRRGPVSNMQGTQEQNIVLVLSQIGGADMDFSDTDLSLNIEDFAERVLDPAVATIIANMESDAFQMFKDIYQFTGTAGSTPAGILPFLNAKTLLNQSLAPKGKGRKVQLDSVTSAAMSNGMTNFFNPVKAIEEQFLEGTMGRASNFDFYENELVPVHTTGTMAGSANVYVNGANQTGTTVLLAGFTAGATITRGTVFTMTGCSKVHMETKQTFGSLQQFVATGTADGTDVYTADANGNVTLNISPAIIPVIALPAVQNPYSNVTASPTTGVAGSVVFQGAASTSYGQNIAYDKTAFTFVTGDMTLPKGMDMCYREVSEGISLRILRGFDIINNVYLSRLDVLYGYLATRPQCAARVTR